MSASDTPQPSGSIHASGSADADEPVCSAKGCRRSATWSLRWNNPKIHTPDRRKTWLACDEHRDHLAGFLSARGFLRETEPCTPGDDRPAQR